MDPGFRRGDSLQIDLLIMQNNNKKQSIIIWTMLALSVIGFIDAIYLSMKALFGSPVTCYAFNGCDIVAQSTYSLLFGIPLSLLGAVFYTTAIILATYYLQWRSAKVLKWVRSIVIAGGIFSLYLVGLQALVIHAWCFYCVISDGIGVVNAVLAVYLLKKDI